MKSIWITLYVISYVNSIQRDRKLACYFLVDQGPASVIDPNLCTHVLAYGLLRVDWRSLKMVFHNYEYNRNVLNELKGLKSQNPDLKIVGVLGCGGNDCPLGKVVVDHQKRADFVDSALKLVGDHQFDGLDLDWEYPGCPSHKCEPQYQQEKSGFSSLLKELKKSLSNGKTLSAAVHPISWLSENAYVFETMASLDFLNIMDYDAAGGWDGHTGHHANFQWVQRSMNYWASKNIPKHNLLMGIPFYGVKFTLKDPNQKGFNAPIIGESTQITYTQICQHIKNDGWKKERTDRGPIAYSGNQWVGFDDTISAAEKAKWVRDNGFGGVMVWETNQDDIHAKCSSIDRPLMRAVAKVLFSHQIDNGCEQLWFNKCLTNTDCCSKYCDKPGHWKYGVCKPKKRENDS